MEQVIDWQYYSSHFPQIVPESQFEAVEAQAEIEYNKVVKPYMEISDDKKQNAVFEICNFLWSNRTVMSGKAVASVSNNGYSESYAIKSKEEAKAALTELIYDCIGTRLAGAF